MGAASAVLFDNTLGGVKTTTRTILGDQEKDWTPDSYLDPIVNHCYKLEILYLSETCAPYITKVATVLNVPYGTTDLGQYQSKSNQPLYGLIDVFRDSLDWKPAGSPENYYKRVIQRDKLPNYTLNAPSPVNVMYFEWRAYVLYLTPLPFNVDIRVRGEFIPPPLVREDDIIQVHPLLGPALAEESAACASRERANPGQMQAYELTGTQALDNISNQLVRSQQGTTVRLGRMANRGGGRGGYGGWGGQ